MSGERAIIATTASLEVVATHTSAAGRSMSAIQRRTCWSLWAGANAYVAAKDAR
jgi:hypothetical protein